MEYAQGWVFGSCEGVFWREFEEKHLFCVYGSKACGGGLRGELRGEHEILSS